MIWTIPNILTFARMLAAPCVALAFLAFERPFADWIAAGLFVAASATDYFDGWLARKLKQQSAIGRILDPVADKAMVMIALFTLAALHGMNWLLIIPAVIVILREALIPGLREHISGAALSVTTLAKWKTTAQMLAIGLLLFAPPLRQTLIGCEEGVSVAACLRSNDDMTALLGVALLWMAALLTVITGWDYTKKAMAYIHAREGA